MCLFKTRGCSLCLTFSSRATELSGSRSPVNNNSSIRFKTCYQSIKPIYIAMIKRTWSTHRVAFLLSHMCPSTKQVETLRLVQLKMNQTIKKINKGREFQNPLCGMLGLSALVVKKECLQASTTRWM